MLLTTALPEYSLLDFHQPTLLALPSFLATDLRLAASWALTFAVEIDFLANPDWSCYWAKLLLWNTPIIRTAVLHTSQSLRARPHLIFERRRLREACHR